MTADQKLEALAKRIARQLFTNFAEQRAKRLVLEMPDGRMGGGWCEEAAADHILETIRQAIREDGVDRKNDAWVQVARRVVWQEAIGVVKRRLRILERHYADDCDCSCCIGEMEKTISELKSVAAGNPQSEIGNPK